MPAWTAVVVTWNSADEVRVLLEGAARHLAESPEWVVVDNASTDGTPELVAELAPEATVLALAENRGFGAANNLGVAAATTDVVVLVNPDVELVDGSLAELAALARTSGALCGARLLWPDGSRQISAHPPLGSWPLLPLALLPAPAMPRSLRRRCAPWRLDERLEVGWLSGACLAGRRDVLTRLGPFDERIHLYGEDIDLGLRAAAAGVPSVFAPDVARVVHAGGRSAQRRFADAGAAGKLAARRWVAAERLGRRRAAWDLACEILSHAMRLAAKTLTRRPTGYERSWFAALGRRRADPTGSA